VTALDNPVGGVAERYDIVLWGYIWHLDFSLNVTQIIGSWNRVVRSLENNNDRTTAYFFCHIKKFLVGNSVSAATNTTLQKKLLEKMFPSKCFSKNQIKKKSLRVNWNTKEKFLLIFNWKPFWKSDIKGKGKSPEMLCEIKNNDDFTVL